MSKLSDLLKARRLYLRKKTEEVSKSSGVSMSVISRLENDLSQPTVTSMVKLAYGLSLTSYEVSMALGVKDYFGRAVIEPKTIRENDMPLFLGDVEGFLFKFKYDIAETKKFLFEAYDEVICKTNPTLPKDAARTLARDSIKNATFPTSKLYTPLPYPHSIKMNYLETALIKGGILIFSDVGYYIRELRVKRNWSILDLSARAKISNYTISRLERGLIDRLFLNEIIRIDDALNTDGLIFNMYWAAGEFHSGVIFNKSRGLELDPQIAWVDREFQLADTVVKIERWSASLDIPFLDNLRRMVF